MKKKFSLNFQKVLFSLALFSLPLIGMAQGKTDFSGTWKLNRSQSKLNAEFSMSPGQITINQKGNSLTSVRVSNFEGEEFTQTATYTLDGKDSKNTGFQDTEIISQASWASDGTTLQIKTTVPLPDGGNMTINETYKMDGSNLTIENQFEGPWGESSETWVYVKQ